MEVGHMYKWLKCLAKSNGSATGTDTGWKLAKSNGRRLSSDSLIV